LVSLYAKAYQLTGRPLYKEVVYETLAFVERELSSPEGAFYSSLDADTEGEEGKFYVWTQPEVNRLLKDQAALFSDYYHLTEEGNWEEGKNILYRADDEAERAAKYSLTPGEIQSTLQKARLRLLQAREKRVRPGLDDKVLTSWNALMMQAYIDAYRVFGEEKFRQVAQRNATFLTKRMMRSDFRLYRNYKKGKVSVNAFLDDYSFLAGALIDLYQATFDEKWLNTARSLAEYSLKHFYDAKSSMFFYTSDLDPALIVRQVERYDQAIPSSNSEMARNLYRLGLYFANEGYLKKSEAMLSQVRADMLKYPPYFTHWAGLLMAQLDEPYEVAIVGSDWLQIRRELDQHYLPHVLLSGGKDEGSLELLQGKLVPEETYIYVCRQKSCKRPVQEVRDALAQMKVKPVLPLGASE
ncbi:MAG: thioredoxin domain-containing protein, partial [Bacteroidia bacterium]|nr:thioredoxin domain-containing protein [Bacteroidia bacterium]